MNDPNALAEFRLATEDDSDLPTFDHTKLSAINTCPTWGILRYQMHKRMPGDGRNLALEAGSAMHEVFAFIRLASLIDTLHNGGASYEHVNELWSYQAVRLFGRERADAINAAIKDCTDITDVCKVGSIAVLDTSGYYDDPRDRRRTLSNLEECAYAYVNRWRFDHPVWMRNVLDPHSDVGIEIAFDVVADMHTHGFPKFRLTGKIDGIHYNSSGNLTVHDNKTASRLGEAWSMSQAINHQFTGYTVAASCFTNDTCKNVEVLGLSIPLPRNYDLGGYERVTMTREAHHLGRWVQWLIHTIGIELTFLNNPFDAPKYTHSCNRYFRPCSFIPFCDADQEEQRIIVSEMTHDEWSPLHKPLLDGVGEE